jgi:hypothetical protein
MVEEDPDDIMNAMQTSVWGGKQTCLFVHFVLPLIFFFFQMS